MQCWRSTLETSYAISEESELPVRLPQEDRSIAKPPVPPLPVLLSYARSSKKATLGNAPTVSVGASGPPSRGVVGDVHP
jgi:hypothetical protein